MCAAVDFVVAGRTCNGGNQVWRFGTGAAQSSQPDMCQYRRFRVAITYARVLTWHSRPRAAFLKSAMIPPCCQSQPFFINQAGGISEQCWYFGWLQLRFTLTTIWYSVDVSVHDTNKRCSHYASCLSRSSWNSQLCGIVRWQPIFIAQASTLHRKTYISPASRSEVWRNDWIVVISPVTTSTSSLVS